MNVSLPSENPSSIQIRLGSLPYPLLTRFGLLHVCLRSYSRVPPWSLQGMAGCSGIPGQAIGRILRAWAGFASLLRGWRAQAEILRGRSVGVAGTQKEERHVNKTRDSSCLRSVGNTGFRADAPFNAGFRHKSCRQPHDGNPAKTTRIYAGSSSRRASPAYNHTCFIFAESDGLRPTASRCAPPTIQETSSTRPLDPVRPVFLALALSMISEARRSSCRSLPELE